MAATCGPLTNKIKLWLYKISIAKTHRSHNNFREASKMKKVLGGALIAEVFKREGVKYIFGLAGGHIYAMMEGAEERGIKYIGVRHEMTASFMAEGWALVTGTPGVCTGTAGPGFTNMVTGLASAANSKTPVVCIGGKCMVTENDRNDLQDIDQISMVKHICKHARTVLEVERIPEYVGRAIAACKTGRPGPVYLEIPRDIADTEVDLASVEFQNNYTNSSKCVADPEVVAQAVELINKAERPVLVVGSGVRFAKAHEELQAFVEKTGMPMFARHAGRGTVPEDHPLSLGLASHTNFTFAKAVAKSDLVVIIGTTAGYTMNRKVFPKETKIIRVDIDPVEVNNQLDATIAIVGDAKNVLKQFNASVTAKVNKEWPQFLRDMKARVMQKFMPLFTCEDNPIHPVRLIGELQKRLDKDTILVVDGGDSAGWARNLLPVLSPGGMPGIISSGFGALGVGAGYAMAAKLAFPDKKVILFTGDGAFGYYATETETAVRYGINYTTIILNDMQWGMIRRSEANKSADKADFVGLDLSNTRYDKVVEALGGHGEYVTEAKDLGPALDRALQANKPSCVNVMTNPKFGPRDPQFVHKE